MGKLVIVKNFPNRMIAEVAKQILEGEKILCIIQCIDKSGFGSATQGADLYVQEKNLKKAQELLVTIFNGI